MKKIDPGYYSDSVLGLLKSLGLRIRVARKSMGLSQSAVCESTWISRPVLSKIEKGSPTVQMVHYLAVMERLDLLPVFHLNLEDQKIVDIDGMLKNPRRPNKAKT